MAIKSKKKGTKKAKFSAKRPHGSPRARPTKANAKKTTREPKAPRGGKQESAETKAKPRAERTKVNANIYPTEDVKRAIDDMSRNDIVVGYLKKNVSKRAFDVINGLSAPKTDEQLAEELGMKINAVRRILNILQGYGVTNYYVAKNVNGWLSFAWYVNISKLKPFFEYVERIENKRQSISAECNDYFVCHGCYDKVKLIFTFDAAFEENFKCVSCGKGLEMIDRDQAAKLAEMERMKEQQLSRLSDAKLDVEPA